MRDKILKEENIEFRRLKRAEKRYEQREKREEARELKRYEKALDRGLGLEKNWL